MSTALKYITDGKRHLICQPYSVENLHRMAAALGIRRCWYHKGRLPHYDIPMQRIAEIIKQCAMVSPKELVNIIKDSK